MDRPVPLRLAVRRSDVGAPEIGVVALALAWVAVTGVGHDFISFSDGAYLYAASNAAERGLGVLYGTIASSLPPGALLAGAGVWRLSPHVEAVRAALGLLTVAVALLTYRVGRTAAGLDAKAAVAAAAVAAAGPVHRQFVGLEGDAFLTPLALLLVLALAARRVRWAVLLLADGFLFKLTWLPIFAAGTAAVAVAFGRRSATRAAAAALAAVAAAYGALALVFGWSASAMVDGLLLAQSHSGLQLELAGGIVVGIAVLWWPFLVLAPAGAGASSRELRYVAAGAAACVFFMAKQGTYFNVLDPFEPFLVLLAVAGAVHLGRRTIVVACAVAAVLHVASLTSSAARTALPAPIGAALVDVHNAHDVDRLVAAIQLRSRPGDPVLVNPFLAVLARRREIGDAADWFILRALGDGRWEAARRAHVPVATLDENIALLDGALRPRGRPVLRVDRPPLVTVVYASAVPRGRRARR